MPSARTELVDGDNEFPSARGWGVFELDKSRDGVGQSDGAEDAGRDLSASSGVGDVLKVVAIRPAHKCGVRAGSDAAREFCYGRDDVDDSSAGFEHPTCGGEGQGSRRVKDDIELTSQGREVEVEGDDSINAKLASVCF